MSKLGFTAVIAGLGYLLFKILCGAVQLLYLFLKIVVLLPIAAIALIMRSVHVTTHEDGSTTLRAGSPPPAPAPAGKPGLPPDLGPATHASTGDWRKDRETLIRLLDEGKIK